MFRRFLTALSILGILAGAAVVTAPAFAEEKAKSSFSDAQISELNAMIKQVILDNPQTLITSVEAYYNKQSDTKKAQEGRVDQVPAGLYDDTGSPIAGDKNAKFVVVEFFDYNCGYCKQVSSDLNRVIKEEKNVKFVFKELPILSEMSEVAARWALASNNQGKYLEYHNALMEHQGPIDPGLLESIGKDLGLDIIKLKKDSDTQEVRDTLSKNLELARSLGIRGTPFFLVGKTKVPGAIGYSRMKELIMKERDGVVSPVAPTPEPVSAVDDTPVTTSGSSDTIESDPDVKAAIEDAKKETNELISDLKKQAEEMKKAAEAMVAKEEAEKAAAAAAGKAAPTAPAAPAEKK